MCPSKCKCKDHQPLLVVFVGLVASLVTFFCQGVSFDERPLLYGNSCLFCDELAAGALIAVLGDSARILRDE